MNIYQLFVKRFLDILFGLIFTAISVVIILPFAICIIVEDGFPVLFKQTRVGKNGHYFNIYKLRSMKKNKENGKIVNYKQWKKGVPYDFIFKNISKKDNNVTTIGRFIRKSSIDELPQFFNVLIGNMSLIGPRPEIPEIANQYNDEQKKRLSVKPGITGWAQVNGRSEIPHGKKIEFDVYYIENQCLLFDMKIFFITIIQTISHKGAI